MTGQERVAYNREEYADLIVFYLNNPGVLDQFREYPISYMNESFAIVHVPVASLNVETVGTYGYSTIPRLFGLTSTISLEASGVTRLRNIPALNLLGNGVLVGVVDTGIDYTNPVFIHSDGTTKIAAIWDQTIETGTYPYESRFGSEYNADMINQALASNQPYNIVPSRDENGHGTMMAGVACGNPDADAAFSGVAPGAELLVVKLQLAKAYLKRFYVVPEDVICFQEDVIMWGIQYCIRKAQDLHRPLVICLGIGSSQGSHDGSSLLARFLTIYSDLPGNIAVISAGNEGNRGRHYFGSIDPAIGYNTVELNVGETERGFSMELWGTSPGIYSIDILSPSGEYIARIPSGIRVNRVINFVFETTVIYLDYMIIESETGDQLILLRFHNISPGIWRFNVYGQGNLTNSFNIWLPMGDMITDSTRFIQPDIYTTILSPGGALIPITVTAYNTANNNLYVNASRGYTRSNNIKPELAAPGVNYIAPNQNREFVPYTGTGVACAHTAGIVAMILEWGVVRGNRPNIDSMEMTNYLIRGARRSSNLDYPNRDWGYGILDVFNVFDALRANIS